MSLDAGNMSPVLGLRDFINERLCAAASEIFRVIEQTIVQYEKEIDRQRRLLDTSWKPETHEQREEQHVCKEESLLDQLLCNQERNTNQHQTESQLPLPKQDQNNPEPFQIKEDQEELLGGNDGEQLELKQEPDTFLDPPYYQSMLHNETDSVPLVHYNFPVLEKPDESVGMHEVSLSTRNTEMLLDPNTNHSTNIDSVPSRKRRGTPLARKKLAKCDICGKGFRDQYMMRRHRRIHTGEKPYTCETCGKSYRYSYHLADHTRSHTGEKPHGCNICGRTFTEPSGLRAHASIHTGRKPYSCKICGKSFRQNGNLNIHMKIHTGEKPFECPLCGKSFIQKSSVKSHMRIHTGEKQFSCEVCGKMFGYRHSMKSHIKNKHK